MFLRKQHIGRVAVIFIIAVSIRTSDGADSQDGSKGIQIQMGVCRFLDHPGNSQLVAAVEGDNFSDWVFVSE